MDTVRHLRLTTPLGVAVFCLLSVCLFSACTLDFEEFNEADIGIDADEDDAGQDIGPDSDANQENNDTTDLPGEFGATCEDNEDCDTGLSCHGQICLSSSESDDDCPAEAGCFQVGEDQLCAPRCQGAQSCGHIDDRDDLSCVYLVQSEPLGVEPHSLARACLPDGDDDGVFSGIDNCPDTPNPTQHDGAADGVGDACADEPRCHQDATDGILDFEATTFRAGEFVIPAVIRGRWLPLVGTVDESSSPESTLMLLDRHSGEWTDGGTLEFGGRHRFFVPSNRGGYYLSPGLRDGSPLGSWTHIRTDGTISYGPSFSNFSSSFNHLRANPVTFPNGETHHLFTAPATTINGIRLYSGRAQSALNVQIISSIGALDSLSGPLADIDTFDAPQPLHFPGGSSGFALWNPDSATLVLADLTGPQAAKPSPTSVTELPIPEEWTEEVEADEEPLTEDLSGFDPIAVTAPGGQLYVFDRTTGRAGRFLATAAEDDAQQRSWSNFERLPDYDIDAFEDLDNITPYLLPGASGLGLVGRPAEGSATGLQVRELYFACHPGVDTLDTDEDGVADFVDNCPSTANPEQHDLDGDGWGDACDSDTDGDGIPDGDDFIEIPVEPDPDNPEDPAPEPEIVDLSMDSTNDEVDNSDSDDSDGDGLPNQFDPFPLDSSNDGTPNRWTNDASGNGYSDNFLKGMDRNPYRYYSLPTGRHFAYITEDDDGQRTLFHGELAAPEAAQALDLPDDVEPHELSFSPDGDSIYFLAAAPGQGNRFLVYNLIEDELTLDQDVYPDDIFPDYPNLALRSVSMRQDGDFTIVHESGDSQTWRVSRVTPGDEFSRTQIFSEFPHIWFAHFYQDILVFVGADNDCRDCAGAYRYDDNADNFDLIASSAYGVDAITARDDYVALAGPIDTDTDRQQIRHLSNQGASIRGTINIDEDLADLNDLDFSHYRSSDGSLQPFITPATMVTARRHNLTHDLWIYLPHLSFSDRQWQLLVASDDAIVEAGWAP